MTKAVFHFNTQPGKSSEYAKYVREHRLSDAALESASVEEWSIFVQGDNVVVYLQSRDVEESIRILTQNPEAQQFERGEAEFLIFPETFTPMQQVIGYARSAQLASSRAPGGATE